MKKLIISLFTLLGLAGSLVAQEIKQSNKNQIIQVTTVESVLAGGLGRSKIIITNADGTQKDSDINNLFSATGINFKNIKENEEKFIKLLKSYIDDGWKLEQVIPLTLSQNDGGSGGIFMTRYLLTKDEQTKTH